MSRATTSRTGELEKKISEMALDKRITKVEMEQATLRDNMSSITSSISTLSVQIGTLNHHNVATQELLEKINTKLFGDQSAMVGGYISQLESVLTTFATKRDLEDHLKYSDNVIKEFTPVIKWGRERMVLEKFMLAGIGFIGASNLATLIYLGITWLQTK